MKYVVSVAFALIGSLALLGCARKPLTPVTPWADVVGDSLSFFTVATDPEGLKVCYVFDWGDDSTTTTGYFNSGDTGYCPHEFTDTRVHYVRVMSRNEKGAHSGWSPSRRFRLSQPPQLADTIAGFRCGAVDRWYHATVRVSDPDGDSVAVRFVWGDLPAAGWSAFVPSGSVVSDSCEWSVVGPHTVRVVLKDKGCTISCPSEVKTVNVSQMAVTWYRTSGEVCYVGTPALGTIGGEPALYCLGDESTYCYSLDGGLRWTSATSVSGCPSASLSQDGTRLYYCDDHGVLFPNTEQFGGSQPRQVACCDRWVR